MRKAFSIEFWIRDTKKSLCIGCKRWLSLTKCTMEKTDITGILTNSKRHLTIHEQHTF